MTSENKFAIRHQKIDFTPSLKILIFNQRCTKHPQAGGAERATYEIARRWVRLGHKVHLVTANFPGGKRTDNIDGIKVTRLGGKYSLYIEAFLFYLLKLNGKYDVVIDEVNMIPFLTPLFVRVPKVAFIHQIFGSDLLKEELPWYQAKLCALMEPHLLRLYKNIPIITSKSTRKDLLKIGIDNNNIKVTNYGVDHSLYKPGKSKSSFPLVCYLGRLKRYKGVHYLIEAMTKVVEQIPEAKLNIVGRGDSDYEIELRRLSKHLQLEGNIIFHNLAFRDSLYRKVELMQEAWVQVLPSIREGFGLVVAEASACGTPTIAANVPGLQDTVQDYETGILVPRRVDALAESITHVLNDGELRGRLSKGAFEWSMNLEWDLTANQILEILQKTILSNETSA